MPIPLATTTITVWGRRPQTDIDPDDPVREPPSIVVAGVRAVISGVSSLNTEGVEIDRWQLRCDLCDITKFDYVVDDTTGKTYTISKLTKSLITTFGLDHAHGELVEVTGLPSEGGTDYDS